MSMDLLATAQSIWTTVQTDDFKRLACALINGTLCACLWFSCACRLNLMNKESTKKAFRYKYIFLMLMTSISGWSPLLLNEWPGWNQIGLTASFFFVLWGAARAWKTGVPIYARTDTVVSGWMTLDIPATEMAS